MIDPYSSPSWVIIQFINTSALNRNNTVQKFHSNTSRTERRVYKFGSVLEMLGDVSEGEVDEVETFVLDGRILKKTNYFNKLLTKKLCTLCTINSKINGIPKGVQVNLLWLKSSVASKWASKHLWGGTIYFAVDGIGYSFDSPRQ